MPGQHWGERDGKQPSRLETVVFGVIGEVMAIAQLMGMLSFIFRK
jgi:hypothetical protein